MNVHSRGQDGACANGCGISFSKWVWDEYEVDPNSVPVLSRECPAKGADAKIFVVEGKNIDGKTWSLRVITKHAKRAAMIAYAQMGDESNDCVTVNGVDYRIEARRIL